MRSKMGADVAGANDLEGLRRAPSDVGRAQILMTCSSLCFSVAAISQSLELRSRQRKPPNGLPGRYIRGRFGSDPGDGHGAYLR